VPDGLNAFVWGKRAAKGASHRQISPIILSDGYRGLQAASPNGALLATAHGGTILLWNVGMGTPPIRMGGNLPNVTALAFSPDGGQLASAIMGWGILVWNLSEKRIEFELPFPYEEEVTGLEYTPDGKNLVTGSENGRILIWDLDPESWKRKACAIAARNLTREEWEQYLPGEPYRKTCPEIPDEKSVSPAKVWAVQGSLVSPPR